MTEKKWKVGDLVFMTGGRRGEGVIETHVHKVGTKFFYLRPSIAGQARFQIATGREESHYGSPRIVYTPEEWKQVQRRNSITKRLREVHSVHFEHAAHQDYSTDTLRSLLAVLDGDLMARRGE